MALLILLGGFIFPRVVQASPELRASQASVLEIRLQQLYDNWRLAGGVHGPGDKKIPELLTQNLLTCFTSPVDTPYASAIVGPRSLGHAGVYERPSLSPNPSHYRIPSLSQPQYPPVEFTDASGLHRFGVLLPGNFAAAFDGSTWHIKAIF